jgi:NTP pyrophosphatase (non-canonical NTP hydrolase)
MVAGGGSLMPDQETTVADLRQRLHAFVAEREWQRYHDAKNLAMSLAIEAGELMEHFQWIRNEELATVVQDPRQRAEIADEMADVACYLLSLANALEIDLADAVIAKIAKNERKYPADEFRGRYAKPRQEG